MRRVAALLAAALLPAALAACGGGGAEPGAPRGATLVLDFQPNAVHAGIYAAERGGDFRARGLDLGIREPSSTADSANLLQAGRADFAVMDISDFAIARERGLGLVAVAAIVQRPLASVIARDRHAVRTPADLAGKTIGVTGVPSDDAVLDSVLRSGGVDPSDVHRVTIGFNAVADLAAGRIDAATAFWNAEGVQLERMGIPIREFRVDEFGAPRYPELLVATTRAHCGLAGRLEPALQAGYDELRPGDRAALGELLDSVPGLSPAVQGDEFTALIRAGAFSLPGKGPAGRIDVLPGAASAWTRWAAAHGLIPRGARATVQRGFRGCR